MSNRLLAAVVVLQGAVLLLLVADRLAPVAHAQSVTRCEIANWPDALTGRAAFPLRVVVEQVDREIPVRVQATSTLGVAIKDWDTWDRVQVEVKP
jgi:hypothetical protein